ncbi:Uncharacterized protein AXF42_Ash016882 [Apostasia shenzhenica]|uniref:Uncharacterized protein n=1 Tax=Apostasia shenzhenica TaxID=1088818 RepID=A0A2H9ZRD8_9ASPA|nr:Uncharacterized protein AXF42_Ash016882 [Apostasia shenzhenica]
MRRGSSRDSFETVIAAASAVSSAERRVQPVTVPRHRWKAWLGMFLCFGSQRQTNRISQAILVPEPIMGGYNPLAPVNPTLVYAPPSSPASFLQSEPPSSTQSPAKFFSLSALAANTYSPTTPYSIFAIGPYANDTKLVTPPVFSAFTTEPSTAPFTPPEPVLQTTPSSPEVPFAKLLSSSLQSNCKESNFYDLQPGSPISHLISPTSVCSGTSSPFPDMEFHPASQPPKILSAGDLALRKLVNHRFARDNISILDGQITAIGSSSTEDDGNSFEFTARDVYHFMERKLETKPYELPGKTGHPIENLASKEFNFNFENEFESNKNWVLFPLTHPAVS